MNFPEACYINLRLLFVFVFVSFLLFVLEHIEDSEKTINKLMYFG